MKIVRPATHDDIEAITAIYAYEVTTGTATFELVAPDVAEMTRRWQAIRQMSLPWLVADRDNGAVGYAYASPFRPRPAYRYGVEVSIYVHPDARGAGLGQMLLLALIEDVRRLNMRHMIAAISDSSTSEASIRLHQRKGFRHVGLYNQVGWKFDRWLDVTLLQFDLDPDGSHPVGPGLNLSSGLA